MPYPIALCARLDAAVCFASGTLIAYWLFCTKNTTGARYTAAKFSASWQSPSLVAPSPTNASATTSSPASRAACASPTACKACVASGVHWGAVRCSYGSYPQCQSPRSSVSTSTGSMPRVTSATLSR